MILRVDKKIRSLTLDNAPRHNRKHLLPGGYGTGRSVDLADSEIDLHSDVRWQLIERIVQTKPFQKSSRLPALLRYLAEWSISSPGEGLTEQKIGQEVFGKHAGYTPVEDSSVRVHVRQLRLRLHEYFDSEGRHESLIAEIPKGGYALVFHNPVDEAVPSVPPATPPPVAQDRAQPKGWRIPSGPGLIAGLSGGVALLCALGWYHTAVSARDKKPPWPLDGVIQSHVTTTVVVADSTFILRMLGDKEVSLDEYANLNYLKAATSLKMDAGEARLVNYLSVSRLTSIADVLATASLVRLAGVDRDNLVFLSARDVHAQNMDHGNYIFVGSKTSNPWVELFEDRLNFQFVEESPGGDRYILNKKPRSGEQSIYRVPESTGVSGIDYATISLLPNRNGEGSVLILQGLRLEGTEAAEMLLGEQTGRDKLLDALGKGSDPHRPIYFEALLEARSAVGSPGSVNIIAARLIQH